MGEDTTKSEEEDAALAMEVSGISAGALPREYLPFSGDGNDGSRYTRVVPVEALLNESDIAGFLNRRATMESSRSWRKAALFGAFFCAGLFVLFLMPLRIFAPFRSPPRREAAVPGPYLSESPEKYSARIRAINDDMRGERWLEVALGLEELSRDAEPSSSDMPPDLKSWVFTERLVALAKTGAKDPEAAYRVMERLAQVPGRAVVPFRAFEAYVTVLHAAGIEPGQLLEVLDVVRANYAGELNRNPVLLDIEAQTAVKCLPEEYVSGDPRIAFLWKRVDDGIAAYRLLSPEGDRTLARLERLRWEKALGYFSFFDRVYSKSIELGGDVLTRSDVENRLALFQ